MNVIPPPSVEPIDELRDRVLAVCARVLALGGLPLVAIVAFQNWIVGRSVTPLAIEGAIVLIVLVNLRRKLPLTHRSVALVVGVLVIMTVATAVFGATMGTGMFYFGVVFVCGILLQARALVAVVFVQAAIVAGVWVAHDAGVIAPQYMPDTPTYVRIVVSTLLTSIFAALVVNHFARELRRALQAERDAREAQARAHEEQRRTAKAAEGAQRLEALGRLAGGVAHDVNNALAIIQGNLSVLQGDLSDDERAEALADIEHGVARASDTTRQLVSIVQLERGAGTTAPARSLETLVRSVKRAIPPTIRVSLHLESDREIPVSEGQFEQAVLNLIINGQDAMEDVGELTISCADDGNDVVIAVADTGHGIPDEVRDHLFEPFFTTKGVDGTGVGLTMVWGLVVGAGGHIVVEQPETGGTRFVMRFPAVTPKTDEAVAETPPNSTLSVLLLEDQPLVRRALVRMLETIGHRVVTSATTAEAVAVIDRGALDLFITDGHVPDAPVRVAVTAFRGANPGAPVILCTGNPAGIRAFDDAADVLVLQKPFNMAALKAKIAEALPNS